MLPAKAATEASRIRNSTFIDRQGYQSRTVVAPSRKCIVRVGLNQGLRGRSTSSRRKQSSDLLDPCNPGQPAFPARRRLGRAARRYMRLHGKNNVRQLRAYLLEIGHEMPSVRKIEACQTKSSSERSSRSSRYNATAYARQDATHSFVQNVSRIGDEDGRTGRAADDDELGRLNEHGEFSPLHQVSAGYGADYSDDCDDDEHGSLIFLPHLPRAL